MSMQPCLIITHVAPDLDAALGTWLYRRYIVDGVVDWGFVPAGTGHETAAGVIDTGREYSPYEARYDHHQPELADDRTVCAASLVYDTCRQMPLSPEQREELKALQPLVELVTAGDHGRAPDWSYKIGPHAIAASIRARLRGDDHAMLAALHQLIDDIALSLWMRARVEREFQNHGFPLADNIMLIRNGSALMTRYALDELKYELVLFVTDSRDQSPATLTVGIQRASESALDCGALVDAMQHRAAQTGDADVVAELERWYRHPSGFFAGRGTAKAPDPSPISERTVQAIASLLVEVLSDDD